MKAARYIPLLAGAAAALSMAAAAPVIASPVPHGNTSGVKVSSILTSGNIVTGVRGTTVQGGKNAAVVLTGLALTGSSSDSAPFLFQGRLSQAAGATVSKLTPPFTGETSATFYGPDTHAFNPTSIPAGKVRAVGSYESSAAAAGVINQGMIYLGPVSGSGGTWTSIDVPADGTNTVGHVRACPRAQAGCFVMDTIPHSTMGDLVVGNYDLNPTVAGGVVSGNAFIYNMTSQKWTLLRLGGSLSSATTLYGIWQDGGNTSRDYTLAGGSSADGGQKAFLMSYNERTGAFGKPVYYTYGNRPVAFTHFEGITAVAGGFDLAVQSSAQDVAMAFVPAAPRFGYLGPARWYPVNVLQSRLCSGDCSEATGDTVYQNEMMGLYVRSGTPGTYLASVPGS
jgi:hypothetical protein